MTGRIVDEHGNRRDFVGWTGLAAALTAILACAKRIRPPVAIGPNRRPSERHEGSPLAPCGHRPVADQSKPRAAETGLSRKKDVFLFVRRY